MLFSVSYSMYVMKCDVIFATVCVNLRIIVKFKARDSIVRNVRRNVIIG